MTASRTRRRARTRLVTALLAVGVGTALAIGGCSSGQDTQTATQVPPVPGANINAGQLSLRNILVDYNGPQGYAVGSDAPLAVRIFNNGQSPVTLVGVSSDKASSVALIGSPTVISPTASPTQPPPTTGTAQPTGTAEPTGTATATATATTPAPAAPVSITIPGQAYVLLVPGQGNGNLVLRNLTAAIAPGESTRLTFTFSDGTTATVDAPLVPTSAESVTRDPAVVPAETSGE